MTYLPFLLLSLATAWQCASGIRRPRWRLWVAYPIMTSFRYVPYVRYVACVALDGNPAYGAIMWWDSYSEGGGTKLKAAECIGHVTAVFTSVWLTYWSGHWPQSAAACSWDDGPRGVRDCGHDACLQCIETMTRPLAYRPSNGKPTLTATKALFLPNTAV